MHAFNYNVINFNVLILIIMSSAWYSLNALWNRH